MFRFEVDWRLDSGSFINRRMGNAAGWIAVHERCRVLSDGHGRGSLILFLRKQLAYYQEHQIRPRRLTDAARLSLVLCSRLFEWKEALVIVTPATFIVGIERVSSCIGVGSHGAVVHRCRRIFAS